MAKLTRDDVLRLAQLSQIKLTESEVNEFRAEFNEILHYVEQLQNADVKNLKPTNQVTGLTTVTRKDEMVDYGYDPKTLLQNVPYVEDSYIKTKRMIG